MTLGGGHFAIGGSQSLIPGIGLGTWKSQPGDVGRVLKEAIVKHGYRHIDCASIYGNEKEIGSALKDIFEDTEVDIKREDLWITSKLWNNSHGPHVIDALENTLNDLGLDYLDLYLIHWPVVLKHGVTFPDTADDMIPFDESLLLETWKGMEKAVNKGLVKHIGVSNFSIPKLQQILKTSQLKPQVNQIERHPYLQQQKLIDFCKSNDIHVTNYSPLGSGDRGFKKDEEPVLLNDPVIATIAQKHSCTSAQVLLAWALHTGTSVAVKSVSSKRLEENFAAGNVILDDDDMKLIESLDRHYRFLHGEFWCLEGSSYNLESLWDEPFNDDGTGDKTSDEL